MCGDYDLACILIKSCWDFIHASNNRHIPVLYPDLATDRRWLRRGSPTVGVLSYDGELCDLRYTCQVVGLLRWW